MKLEPFRLFLTTFISGILLALTSPTYGDGTVVWDSDNGFDPATVVIGPGDSVMFQNLDPYGFDVHISFNGGLNFDLPNFTEAPVAFPLQAGGYGYYSNFGDHGIVIVAVPPTVTITSLTNNTIFSAPANFTVQVNAATSASDSVTEVQIYLGTGDSTNSIADLFSPPFAVELTNLAAGTYTLIVVATDQFGLSTTNTTMFTVTASTPAILSAPRITAGKLLFDVSGLSVGKTNLVQFSSDLSAWAPVQTNVASAASMTITNTSTSARQFYRILQLP